MSQAEEKIAAIVVTYNRKDLLGRCLDSLLVQSRPLNALYIVDNHSADGTYDFLLARRLIAPVEPREDGPVETVKTVATPGGAGRSLEVHYLRLSANTGGAGGFHEGMKRAAGAGFDWLWLMDDDLLTAPDALAVLTRQADALRDRGEESFLLNSLVLVRAAADDAPDAIPPVRETDALAFPLQELHANNDPNSGTFHPRRGVYHWRFSEIRDQVKDGLYRWACPFNGTFVPARVVAEIGLPNKDFFIWGEERDFLWRAARRFSPYTSRGGIRLATLLRHPQRDPGESAFQPGGAAEPPAHSYESCQRRTARKRGCDARAASHPGRIDGTTGKEGRLPAMMQSLANPLSLFFSVWGAATVLYLSGVFLGTFPSPQPLTVFALLLNLGAFTLGYLTWSLFQSLPPRPDPAGLLARSPWTPAP